MDSSIFTWFIDKIIGNQKLKLATAKDKAAIISKLGLAILETDKHIQDNRDKETLVDIDSTELVKSWNKVAELVWPYDSYLARLFDSKSKYWHNPERFKQEIREGKRGFDFRFRLTEVEKIEEELKRIWF